MLKFLIILLISINYYRVCSTKKNTTISNYHITDDHDIYLKKYQYNHNNKNHSTYRILLKRNAFYSKQYPNDKKFTVDSDEKPAKNLSNVILSQLPRPHLRWSQPKIKMLFQASGYQCYNWLSSICQIKTNEYRDIIINELNSIDRKSFNTNNNNNNSSSNNNNNNNEDEINFYNVTYVGNASSTVFNHKKPICAIMDAGVKELRKKDLKANVMSDLILSKRMFNKNVKYKNCAIISSAGSILNSKLGSFIDQHNIVLRFNHAPTKGYEEDVGSKTTLRIVNSQVVSKLEYKFLDSPLFKNITIAAWDPGRYNSTLSEWIANPDFNLFDNYKKYLMKNPKANIYLIDPRTIWKLWEVLNDYSSSTIRKNPPSSGFIGIALLLPVCETLNIFDYIPSTRFNEKCHYYDDELNPGCTFGSWHPLAAEKLMILKLNMANVYDTFQHGILRLNGMKAMNNCK